LTDLVEKLPILLKEQKTVVNYQDPKIDKHEI